MKRWRTLMLTLLLTLTLGFLVLTWPAVAQDRPCAADVQKLCKDLGPDNQGGMIQCLKDHDTDLSDACKARIRTSAMRKDRVLSSRRAFPRPLPLP